MSTENKAASAPRSANPACAIEAVSALPAALDRPVNGSVDVWVFAVDAAEPSDSGILSPAECARRDRFVSMADRNRFAGARIRLRRLLGAYLSLEPAAVPLIIGANGKPRLGGGSPRAALEFNLAHGQTHVAIACSGSAAVGIDIEPLDRACDLLGLARHFFHPNEARTLERCDPAERGRLFFRWWTAKEAVLKACGTGIGRVGLSTLDFSAWTDETATAVRAMAGYSWSVWRYAIGGCALALAVEGPLLAIRLRSMRSSGDRSGEAMTRSS